MHIFKAYLHGRFLTSWGGLGLSLLNIVVAYLYCIASLHLFIAYLYCISLLHIFKAYLYCISLLSCCCLLLFGSWVDFWSFGGVFVRFLVVLEWSEGCFGRSFGGLGGSWAAPGRSWVGPGRSRALLGRSWRILGRSWPLLSRSWALMRSGASPGASEAGDFWRTFSHWVPRGAPG